MYKKSKEKKLNEGGMIGSAYRTYKTCKRNRRHTHIQQRMRVVSKREREGGGRIGHTADDRTASSKLQLCRNYRSGGSDVARMRATIVGVSLSLNIVEAPFIARSSVCVCDDAPCAGSASLEREATR